jgi:hypothetical protein
MYPMSMKLLDQVKKERGLTNYGVAKQLRSLGVEITTQGIDQYDKGKARSMRLDVLCGLKRLLGARWEAVGKLLEEEFGNN